ncbi:MAG: hypothetical protein WD688_07315 [Candidatus Binatia bacterium]
MDQKVGTEFPSQDLVGRHVLVLLPQSRKDTSKYLVSLFQEAKLRWNWRISMVGENVDRAPFEKLLAPNGNFYSRPYLLRVQEWEDDPEAVAANESRFREAELVLGVPAGRQILAAGHSIGRAFNAPLIYPKRSKLLTKVLRNNREPYRILQRVYRHAEEIIELAKPDVIFAWERVTPINSMICTAAASRHIPCFVHRRSKIHPDRGYWTTDRIMLNPAIVELAQAKCNLGESVSEEAKAYIQAFRDQPSMIKYIAARWRDKSRRGIIRWHVTYVRIIFRELINSFRGQDRWAREPGWSRIFRYYRGLYLSSRQQRFFCTLDEGALMNTKYVYFPLHKEAELAQTFQSTLWHDQRNTIRVLASMLPFGYRLLVREHRLNYGRRPTRYYEELLKLPNVVVIDPYDSQFKYLRNADLIVTENGSSGWEGLLLRKPVIILSSTFYDGAGLGTKVKDPDQLNAAILDALTKAPVSDPEAYDQALGYMIDAENEMTFPMTVKGMPIALDRMAETLGPALQEREASPAPPARASSRSH